MTSFKIKSVILKDATNEYWNKPENYFGPYLICFQIKALL